MFLLGYKICFLGFFNYLIEVVCVVFGSDYAMLLQFNMYSIIDMKSSFFDQ